MPYLMKLTSGEEIICMTMRSYFDTELGDSLGLHVTHPTVVEYGLPVRPWITGLSLKRQAEELLVPHDLIVCVFSPEDMDERLIRSYMNIDDEDDLPVMDSVLPRKVEG